MRSPKNSSASLSRSRRHHVLSQSPRGSCVSCSSCGSHFQLWLYHRRAQGCRIVRLTHSSQLINVDQQGKNRPATCGWTRLVLAVSFLTIAAVDNYALKVWYIGHTATRLLHHLVLVGFSSWIHQNASVPGTCTCNPNDEYCCER